MIPVVVPTKGRAGRILTLKAISPVILCVAESERKDYADAHPDVELLVHPDSVQGISPKRQWIYEQVGDVLMVDDDLAALVQTHDLDIPSRMTAEHAYDIVQTVGENARQMGVYLWGLANSHDARYYDANRPIRRSGFIIACCMGLFAGSRLHFPPEPDCLYEDYFIPGLNAYYYRTIYADTRWGFQPKNTFHNEGGLSNWRTTVGEEDGYEKLRQLFGDAIVKRVKPSTAGDSAHKFQKNLRIPW